MKHLFTIIILLLLAYHGSAQKNVFDRWKLDTAHYQTDLASDIRSIELIFGYRQLDLAPLNATLANNYGMEIGPMYQIGHNINLASTFIPRVATNTSIGANFFISQKQSHLGNELRVLGYETYSFTGVDFLNKQPNADLSINLGLYLGGYKLQLNKNIRYSNFMFGPAVSVQPKFILNKIVMTPFATYFIDLVDSVWKVRKGEDVAIDLPLTRFTGLTLGLGVGLGKND